MLETIAPWALFTLFVIGALILDLKVFHKEEREISVKEALALTVFWISLALIYCAGIYLVEGSVPATQFLTGYLIEKSLSVDNLFVFILIFTYFQIPSTHQHKVLFWGILGAIVMRLIFIFAGIALIHAFHWIMYVFGAFLVFTGVKLSMHHAVEVHPEKSVVLKLFRKIMPIDDSLHGGRFFIKRDGALAATPMLVALVFIETSDVIFAMDSIPAILAITLDPFIVFTSNIFAILGLRSLFFALSGFMRMFRFLQYGLSIILIFLGVKMLVAEFYRIPVLLSLGVIAAVLIVCAAASVLAPGRA